MNCLDGTVNGAAALFSVTGSAAQMRMASAGAGPTAFLNAVSAADLAGSVDVAIDKMPTGSGFQGNTIVRRVAGTGTTVTDYRVKLRMMPTSTSIQLPRWSTTSRPRWSPRQGGALLELAAPPLIGRVPPWDTMTDVFFRQIASPR